MKHRRARGSIEAFVRQSRLRILSRNAARERRRARRAMRTKTLEVMEIEPSTQAAQPIRHIDELQANFKRLAGEYVDLESCPDAWLLLSVWDESWLRLTNPSVQIVAAQLLIIHAEVNQIIMLLGSYQAISCGAVERVSSALSAVIESRAHAIYRDQGDAGLTVHIIPNFSSTYAPERVKFLH